MSDQRKQVFLPSLDKKRSFLQESKRRWVLKTATEFFAQKGSRKSTISQITKKDKIAEGDVYDYS